MTPKHLHTALLCLLFPLWVMAEPGSPSSRFGFGALNDNMPNELRAMGGVTSPMRSNHTINPAQPASYTAGDSLSFMFDIGMSVGWCNYHDSYGKKNLALGSLEYITMQFPLWKRWIALSCGVVPYSHVNYDFTLDSYARNLDDSYSSTVTHTNYLGKGGLSQVYLGLGLNLLDWFAVGVNGYYNFGTAYNYTVLTFNDATISSTELIRFMDMSAFTTRVGAQFFHTFHHHAFSLGATFDPQLKLGGKYLVTETTTLDTAIIHEGCEAPMSYTVGASYQYNQQLTIAADYSFQNWSNALYFGQKGVLHDRQRISLGLQYQHNMFGLRYHQRMIWRLGAALMNNYAVSPSWRDFSVSIGTGFPLRTSATMINTTIEYNRQTSLPGLTENNLRLIIDVAVNESWFHKRKL